MRDSNQQNVDFSRADGERLLEGQDLPRPASNSIETLHVGDQIRFSTELLKQIHALPDHRSPLVEIERIAREPDGALTLVLTLVAASSSESPF